MIRRFLTGVVPILASFALISGQPLMAQAKKPTILKPCKQCHEEEANYLRGRLKSKSRKAKTLQISMGTATWQLVFDNNTKLNGAEKVTKIADNKEIGIEFEQRGKLLIAKSIDVKQAAEIPQEWVIDVAEMQQLMAKGTKAGNFNLYDARPMPAYLPAHLEGAISNYDAMFDKNVKLLPPDKNKLIIFYCGGPT